MFRVTRPHASSARLCRSGMLPRRRIVTCEISRGDLRSDTRRRWETARKELAADLVTPCRFGREHLVELVLEVGQVPAFVTEAKLGLCSKDRA